MLIEETNGCGTLGGGMGKVPINEEYLRRPTPTFSYPRGFCNEQYIASMCIQVKEGQLVYGNYFSLVWKNHEMKKSGHNYAHGIDPAMAK
jgi:hypothetical protein